MPPHGNYSRSPTHHKPFLHSAKTSCANLSSASACIRPKPGIGRKTANVILNTAFGQPTIAVDTHIFRIANRIGLAPGKTVLEVENKLLKVVPDEFKRNAHHWLILHGRYVCH